MQQSWKEPKELNVKVEISDKFKNFFDDDDIIDGDLQKIRVSKLLFFCVYNLEK